MQYVILMSFCMRFIYQIEENVNLQPVES